MDFSKPGWILLFCALGGVVAPGRAALTWPGCKDLADTDFKITNLANRAVDKVDEPMKMAFDLLAAPGEDAKGKVDVYFTQRKGLLRKFDSRQNKVVTLAAFSGLVTEGQTSDGLLGIALDPAFKQNHQVYLYYSFNGAGEIGWRVSRFTLDNANLAMDMASEKVLLKIPEKLITTHPGGAIQFDAYGDLWITTGNNMLNGATEFPVWSSSNTNDLRGKILRIHPKPDGSYSIPAGNLFPAGKYPAGKTRPEIYVMGARNAYTLALDPVRRWAAFGDIGPDDLTADGDPLNANPSQDNTEEHDLAVAPGNFGYPFFAGANKVMKKGVDPAQPIIPAGMDWSGVPHDGLDTLPPAIPAIHAYSRGCSITGPIYRYNGDLNSSIKFPPHFDRKWLYTDFNPNSKNPITAATLASDGKSITASEQVLKSVTLYKPLDFQQGPDGALYVNNYAGYRTASTETGIIRIDYVGDCRPSLPRLETPASIAAPSIPRGLKMDLVRAMGTYVEVTAEGRFRFEARDVRGKTVLIRRSY
jgi:cytochrome c